MGVGGTLLAAGNQTGELRFWDSVAGKRLEFPGIPRLDPANAVRLVEFANDGSKIVVETIRGVWLWRLQGERPLVEPKKGENKIDPKKEAVPTDPEDVPSARKNLILHVAEAALSKRSLAFAGDSKWLAISVGGDGVTLYDAKSGKSTSHMPAPQPLAQVRFYVRNQDEGLFYVTSRATFGHWETKNGLLRNRRSIYFWELNSYQKLAISGDCQQLAWLDLNDVVHVSSILGPIGPVPPGDRERPFWAREVEPSGPPAPPPPPPPPPTFWKPKEDSKKEENKTTPEKDSGYDTVKVFFGTNREPVTLTPEDRLRYFGEYFLLASGWWVGFLLALAWALPLAAATYFTNGGTFGLSRGRFSWFGIPILAAVFLLVFWWFSWEGRITLGLAITVFAGFHSRGLSRGPQKS